MSKMTVCIKRINEHLERISGLDGIATEFLEIEERRISEVIAVIEKHFSDANIFNYYSKPSPVRCGEWVYGEYDIPHCSECGIHPKETSSYCPNCGAKMEDKDE